MLRSCHHCFMCTTSLEPLEMCISVRCAWWLQIPTSCLFALEANAPDNGQRAPFSQYCFSVQGIEPKCTYCHKTDHFVRDCPVRTQLKWLS